jgi:hypothetical protein
MTSGKYFNKGVKRLMLQILVMSQVNLLTKSWSLEEGDERYDILIAQSQQVGANVLIGLKMYDIVTKFAFV